MKFKPLHKPVILTSTVKGITVNKGRGFQRSLKAWAKEHNKYSGGRAEEHGHVGHQGGGDSGNRYHQRCIFFMWTPEQYCLRRGTRMEQEGIIQPGNSIFSCLILPLMLENFNWHTLFTHRTEHCRDRVRASTLCCYRQGFQTEDDK